MFGRKHPEIQTQRIILRLPKQSDYTEWFKVRRASAGFLDPWEPIRGSEYLSRTSFRQRVNWGKRSAHEKRGMPLFLVRRQDGQILGGLNLDNFQHGVSQSCTVGYWMGAEYARQGYMAEALPAVVNHAFTELDIGRVQAGCLPENAPSRALLEKSGFKYEGVAQSYLQIAGRWRNHVLYANLRNDRRGKIEN